MCGRFTLRTPAGKLVQQFLLDCEPALSPRYNIAPTQAVAVIRSRQEDQQRELATLRWGLVPSWAKDLSIGSRMINARAETVAEKPSFRNAFKQRRCLVLADGYYEWQTLGKQKQPHYIHIQDGRPFAFAGLWERWTDPAKSAESPVETCTIITTGASERTRSIHERMPVILAESHYEQWLNPELRDRQSLEALLIPYDAADLVAEPVSTHVNNPRNDDAQCVTTQKRLL